MPISTGDAQQQDDQSPQPLQSTDRGMGHLDAAQPTVVTDRLDSISSSTFPASSSRSKAAFFDNVVTTFTAGLDLNTLQAQADSLESLLHERLSDLRYPCMLPSFIGRAPSGRERGKVVAIDIGGSTMRVAVVTLNPDAPTAAERLIARPFQKWEIGQDVKDLGGDSFFDWIANNVKTFLSRGDVDLDDTTPKGLAELPLGLVWSFPLNQTSLNDGKLSAMGKSFTMASELEGKSIRTCLSTALTRVGAPLRLDAILNDTVSILLAMSYVDPATKLSIIAGTGFNGALRLPTTAIAPGKFSKGHREHPDWADDAQDHVLVDGELCITGLNIFPKSRWDEAMTPLLSHPDILGLEVLIGGQYLGEVIRQIIVDATKSVGYLGGTLPEDISEPFSLRLEKTTMLLTDTDDDDDVRNRLSAALGLSTQISQEDVNYLRSATKAVMARTAGFLAATVVATRSMQNTCEGKAKTTNTNATSETLTCCTVSCTGAVVEKCPGVRQQSQDLIDRLQAAKKAQTGHDDRLQLAIAAEPSLKGVAVAALMAEEMEQQPRQHNDTDTVVQAEDKEAIVHTGETPGPATSPGRSTKKRSWVSNVARQW